MVEVVYSRWLEMINGFEEFLICLFSLVLIGAFIGIAFFSVVLLLGVFIEWISR